MRSILPVAILFFPVLSVLSASCSLNMKGTWTLPSEDSATPDDDALEGLAESDMDRQDVPDDDPAMEPLVEEENDIGEGREEDASADSATESPGDEARDIREFIDAEIVASDTTTEVICGRSQIRFEAESMTLTGDFAIQGDPRVGQYITDTLGWSGVASIELEIPCSGEWVMWGNVHWLAGDSFFWAWEDPYDVLVWHVMQRCGDPRVDEWHWDEVSGGPETENCEDVGDDPAIVALTAGIHHFYLLGREPYARVDKFIFTDNLSWVPP